MKIKHKLILDFQFTSSDKKIFILKTGTTLEDYKHKVKNETIDIDKDIVDQNPEFFSVIDWKSELLTHLKVSKIPQPSQISKKIIPFIEDMILSSTQAPGITMDDSMVKELERKESDLNSRDRRIKDKEEELEIRNGRIERREVSYKEDLLDLDKKEDNLRVRSKELTDKQLDIDGKIQDIKERERNLDRNLLESAKDIDVKYVELQNRIDIDLKSLSERERGIEINLRGIKRKESELEQLDADISDKIRNFEIRIEEHKNWEIDVKRIHIEIQEWESLNWKMKRRVTPPSAILPD